MTRRHGQDRGLSSCNWKRTTSISFSSMPATKAITRCPIFSAACARPKRNKKLTGDGFMIQKRILAGMALLGSLLIALPLSAHHAFQAEFDDKKPVHLVGKVTKMEWINPHAWIHIDVTDTDGKVTSWMVECGTPNTLLRRGVNKNSVTAGM